ncbi:MAG: DsbA family protein [Pseudobdellovibrionaceae bacterium]
MSSSLSKYFLFFILFGIFCFGLGIWWGSKDNSQDLWAIYGGNNKVHKDDLWKDIQKDVMILEQNIYSIKKQAVRNFSSKKLMTEDSNVSKSVPSRNEESIVNSFSQAELEKKFLEYLEDRGIKKDKLPPSELSNARNNFEIFLGNELRKKKLADIYDQAQIKIFIPRPFDQIVSVKQGPFSPLAKNDNSANIVYIGNFHCPFCKAADARLKEVVEKYKGRVSVYLRLKVSESSETIGFRTVEAAYCAHDQNQFWNFYNFVMANVPENTEDLLIAGEKTGLNTEKLKACVENREKMKQVLQEASLLEKEGVFETPSLIVQGRMLSGVPPLNDISDLIELSSAPE